MIASVLALAAPKPWTLVAGGDIMFYGIAPKTSPLKAIASAFQKADIAYANLEIPLTDSSTATKRKTTAEVKAKHQFILKSDPGHIINLKGTFDFLSLANNHSMDYGSGGLRQTINLLDKAGIQHAGAGENLLKAQQITVKKLPNGVVVGMVSYLAFVGSKALWKCTPATAKSPGLAALDLGGNANSDFAKELIATAKKKCDVLLVAVHWGVERQNKPTPYQISLGRALIDAGADAILGAHPHRLQGREVYKGKPILYSMGNLISPLPASSAIYTLRFEGKKFLSWELRPIRNVGGKATWVGQKDLAEARRQVEALDKLIK